MEKCSSLSDLSIEDLLGNDEDFTFSFVEETPKLWFLGVDTVTYIKSAEGGDTRSIPARFTVNTFSANIHNFRIRARILFDSDHGNYSDVPKRCPSHRNTGPGGYHLLTVVEDSNTKPLYCDDSFSVTFDMLAPESFVNLQFKCYSSCAKGINRKPIKLVFDLLESDDNRTVGHTEIKIKIVGNPERDVKKGETAQPSTGKKRKLKVEPPSSDDEELYTVPSFKVRGKKNFKNIRHVIQKYALETNRSNSHPDRNQSVA